MSYTTNETEFRYYSFNVKDAAKNCPGAIDFLWDDEFGVQYILGTQFEDLSNSADILDGRLLLGKTAVDTYGLIWDYIDLDRIRNKLIQYESLPGDVRRKMTTGDFSCLTGTDFNSIPWEYRQEAYTTFKTHAVNLNKGNIERGFQSSYLFAWARAQIKAGNFEKV